MKDAHTFNPIFIVYFTPSQFAPFRKVAQKNSPSPYLAKIQGLSYLIHVVRIEVIII